MPLLEPSRQRRGHRAIFLGPHPRSAICQLCDPGQVPDTLPHPQMAKTHFKGQRPRANEIKAAIWGLASRDIWLLLCFAYQGVSPLASKASCDTCTKPCHLGMSPWKGSGDISLSNDRRRDQPHGSKYLKTEASRGGSQHWALSPSGTCRQGLRYAISTQLPQTHAHCSVVGDTQSDTG